MNEITRDIMLDLFQYSINGLPALAKKYGVVERTMRRKVDAMINDGYIKLIVTPNIVLLGYKAWARIGIKVSPGSLNNVADILVNIPAIYWVSITLGRYDMLIAVHFRTIEELAHFINSELMAIPGIKEIETFLQVFPRRYNLFTWPAAAYKSAGQNVNNHEYRLQKMDQKILELLLSEGPLKPRELAARLKSSENTVRRYLKMMSQKELFKVEVAALAGMMEYGTHAYTGIKTAGKNPEHTMNAILEHQSVFFASNSIGRFNILIGTRFRNPDLLNRFLTESLPSIPGIASTETYLMVELLKYRNSLPKRNLEQTKELP